MFEITSFRPFRRFAPALLVAALALGTVLPTPPVSAQDEEFKFALVVNDPNLLPCLVNDPNHTPQAHVKIERGDLNDTLHIQLENIKPNLDFDLFTVQKTTKLASGQADPAFVKGNFGLA